MIILGIIYDRITLGFTWAPSSVAAECIYSSTLYWQMLETAGLLRPLQIDTPVTPQYPAYTLSVETSQ